MEKIILSLFIIFLIIRGGGSVITKQNMGKLFNSASALWKISSLLLSTLDVMNRLVDIYLFKLNRKGGTWPGQFNHELLSKPKWSFPQTNFLTIDTPPPLPCLDLYCYLKRCYSTFVNFGLSDLWFSKLRFYGSCYSFFYFCPSNQ